MMRAERRYELVASAVVAAVFVVFWMIAVATSDRPRTFDEHMANAVAWAVFATPSLIAARLLWRAWWLRDGARVIEMDGPARLLAAVVAALHAERRERGAAVAAQLTDVRGRWSRWRFALHSAGSLVFPRRSRRVAALGVVVVAGTAVIAWQSAGHFLPIMQVALLPAAMGIVAVARLERVGHAAPDRLIAITGVAGVLACLAVTGFFLAQHPAAAEHLRPAAAALLGVVLAGLVGLALMPPRMLVGNRLARAVALVGAVALGIGFVLASRLPADRSGGVASYLLLAPVLVLFVGSAVVAWLSGSFRAGIQAAVWATTLGTAPIFVRWLLEAPHWQQNNAGLLLDSHTAPIGGNLLDAIVWTFVLLPVWGLPFGIIGAAVGSGCRRRARAIRDAGKPPEGDAIWV
jgi:hypothetical protein